MIDKKEIRIGNWFIHDEVEWNTMGYSGYFQWKESDWHYLVECGIDLSNIHPIPLTEEILLNCGFARQITTPHILELDLPELGHEGVVEYYDFQKCFTFRMFGDDYNDDKLSFYDKIKYLHQLQNLYFALTNNELKINLHSK